MGEIVNLRQTRKRKARDEAAAVAATNRAKHGRTKAEREAEAANRAIAERTLDGNRRDDQ
ncbi:MAG: DUF4169 family protein [Rhodospirillales bacterium]|nr:DUF4169 family protein [Rhodospirillales bacterium]